MPPPPPPPQRFPKGFVKVFIRFLKAAGCWQSAAGCWLPAVEKQLLTADCWQLGRIYLGLRSAIPCRPLHTLIQQACYSYPLPLCALLF